VLRSGYSSEKLSFGTASGSNGLHLVSVGDSTTAEKKSIARSGVRIVQVFRVSSIKERDWFLRIHIRKVRKFSVQCGADEV